MKAIQWYDQKLTESPISTKLVTSLISFILADLLAQLFEQKKKFDWARIFQLAAFSLPSTLYFHIQCDLVMPYLFPEHKKFSVLKSVLYDQTISSIMYLTMFFTYMGFSSRKNVNQILEKIRNDLIPSLVSGWKVWPILNTISFWMVPIKWRVMYGSICGLVWTAYFSYKQNRKRINDKGKPTSNNLI